MHQELPHPPKWAAKWTKVLTKTLSTYLINFSNKNNFVNYFLTCIGHFSPFLPFRSEQLTPSYSIQKQSMAQKLNSAQMDNKALRNVSPQKPFIPVPAHPMELINTFVLSHSKCLEFSSHGKINHNRKM